jgi:hypothetical protein
MLPFVQKKKNLLFLVKFYMQILHISETIKDTNLKLHMYICGHD